jgi:hypothetical protein
MWEKTPHRVHSGKQTQRDPVHGRNQRRLPTTIHRNDTSGLARRVWEHKSDLVEGFTQKCSGRDLSNERFQCWIPAFAGMTTRSGNDGEERGQLVNGYERTMP